MDVKKCQNSPAFGAKLGNMQIRKVITEKGASKAKVLMEALPELRSMGGDNVTFSIKPHIISSFKLEGRKTISLDDNKSTLKSVWNSLVQLFSKEKSQNITVTAEEDLYMRSPEEIVAQADKILNRLSRLIEDEKLARKADTQIADLNRQLNPSEPWPNPPERTSGIHVEM